VIRWFGDQDYLIRAESIVHMQEMHRPWRQEGRSLG
jgi:hypothetical protein